MSEFKELQQKSGPSGPLDFKNALLDYVRYTEFKRLLNQIINAQKRDGFKTLAVLSEHPQEGKTFFVSTLALGFATLLGKRVLIVDTISQTRNRSLYLDRIFGS